MTRATPRMTRAALLLMLVAASLSSAAFAQADQRKLVSTATLTLSGFLNDPDMHWLRNNINRAKAVLIAPTITKAGFIIGGSGGRAVVVARNAKTGKWAGPAFYVLVTGSVGFQAGVSVSETVSLVLTEKGLDLGAFPITSAGSEERAIPPPTNEARMAPMNFPSFQSRSFSHAIMVSPSARHRFRCRRANRHRRSVESGRGLHLVQPFQGHLRRLEPRRHRRFDGRHVESALLRARREPAGYPDPGIGPQQAVQRTH